LTWLVAVNTVLALPRSLWCHHCDCCTAWTLSKASFHHKK